MKLAYNPKHLGNPKEIFKCFLLGSWTISSLIYFATTENIFIFFLTLGMGILGFAAFITANITTTEQVYIFENIISFAVGVLVSLVINALGYLPVYFVIVFFLVVVIWLRKYEIKKKEEKKKEEQ